MQTGKELLVGTRGWTWDSWAGQFYPKDLPLEWRFCYYSNALRSVLVPCETWKSANRAEVAGWVEDCDIHFHFVLEPPATLCRRPAHTEGSRELEVFLDRITPIRRQTSGILLSVPTDSQLDTDWLACILGWFSALLPVCVDLPQKRQGDAQLLDTVRRHGAGLCWRTETQSEPVAGGSLVVALSNTSDASDQRREIEQVVGAAGKSGQAALFFEGTDAAQRAQQARVIAELIGV